MTAPRITLLIATRNRHKVEEIRAILGPRFRFFCLEDFPDAPQVVEEADTFAGNAARKASSLARWVAEIQQLHFKADLDLPFYVLADDSGLEVDALNGAPGVHSARFAALNGTEGAVGANTPDADNNAKLLRLLEAVPARRRTARFRCVLALAVPTTEAAERAPELFEGICEGRIGLKPAGSGGFGYDPLFIPTGYRQSFAELGEEVKNRLSHRAKALRHLADYLPR